MRTLTHSMAWAVLIIVASVLSGTLLALLPQGSRAMLGPVRTFAFAAALGVVALHMLPEALLELGPWALLALPLGWLAPELLGRLGTALFRGTRRQEEAPRHLALEASYFGLLAHRVGDGIGLGLYTGELSHGDGSGGVVAALSAHAVPVVAIVVLTFDSVRGRGSALKRALGLGCASVLGVLLTQTVLAESVLHASGFINAFVSGMLLHVVSHELRLQLPESATERLYDVVAATAGILTSLLGMGSHAHGQESGVADALLAQLLDLAARALPPLALGALLSLLFLATARRYSTTRWGQAFFSPRAGLDALLLTILIMSPIAAVGRLLVASGFASLSSEGIPRGSTKPGPVTSNRSRPSAAFLERLEAELPYLILAFLLAANIRVALPPELLPSIPWSAQVAGIVLLTRFARIPCGAAALLGLALMPHGLSLAAVMTLLLLGPEAGLAKLSFGSLMRALCLLVAALSLTWVSDVSSQRWEGAIQPQIAGVLLVVSLMLILWAIWRRGFRALFSELLPHHHTGLAPK